MSDFTYGYKTKDNIFLTEFVTDDFSKDYILQTPQEMEKSRVGVCWCQVEYQRFYFENFIKIPFKTFYIEQDNEERASHTFLIYYQNNKCYHFENAFFDMRGIREFDNNEKIFKMVALSSETYSMEPKFSVWQYNRPEYHIDCEEFMNNATTNKRIMKFKFKYGKHLIHPK